MRRYKLFVAAAVLAVVAFSVRVAIAWRGPSDLIVDVLDVGQGDSILVHRGRDDLLVDGGPDRTALSSLGVALPPGDDRIEFVVLTHPDADHIDGLFSVLSRYDVGTLVVAKAIRGKKGEPSLERLAEARGTKVVAVERGDKIRLDDAVTLDVLWPPPDPWPDTKVNNASVVLAVDGPGPGIEALLTGDIESPTENKLVTDGLPHVTLLKAPHHGSDTSSSPAFLDALTPKLVGVSVGAGNHYGQPSQTVLMRYRTDGVRAYRTDRLGTLRFAFGTDGSVRVLVRSWWGWRGAG